MKKCQGLCLLWLNIVAVIDSTMLWIKERAHKNLKAGIVDTGMKKFRLKGYMKAFLLSKRVNPLLRRRNWNLGLAATLYTENILPERYALMSSSDQSLPAFSCHEVQKNPTSENPIKLLVVTRCLSNGTKPLPLAWSHSSSRPFERGVVLGGNSRLQQVRGACLSSAISCFLSGRNVWLWCFLGFRHD